MRPNRYMNGGLEQTSQSVNYVDDDSPRLILNISNLWIDDNESIVTVSAITKSSNNEIWHSDVVNPEMRSFEKLRFSGCYITVDDLFFVY